MKCAAVKKRWLSASESTTKKNPWDCSPLSVPFLLPFLLRTHKVQATIPAVQWPVCRYTCLPPRYICTISSQIPFLGLGT